MEREGEGMEKREGRRRGGEKMRGIVIGGMVLSLLIGCNNGIAELEKNNKFLSSLANLGNDFLSVFTSFGDIFTGTLGFKSDTKKSEVATYFKKVQDNLESTKTALNKIVDDMKREGNPNVSGTEAAVKTLNGKLTKIIEGANAANDAIGNDPSELIGNVEGRAAGGGAGTGFEKIVKGIQDILEVVVLKEGNPEAGTEKKASDGNQRTGDNTAGEAGKLFGNSHASDGKTSATDAAKAVGAVTGADILKAISQGEAGGAFKLAKDTTASGSIAKKDAEIAGAMALRAMTKGGKFANASDPDAKKTVESTAVSAVKKALDTLTIAIRKTIDEGLKKVTGADILQAMAQVGGNAAKLANTSPTANTDVDSPNDGIVAAGVALRAMAKGGKFANAHDGANPDVATAVKRAAKSAVNKALDTLTIAIRKTIDEGLKEVKKVMNITANDHPVTSETGTITK